MKLVTLRKIDRKSALALARQAAALAAVGWAVVRFYHCPLRMLTGHDCPGCGLTRALLALLRLDFSAAAEYHPLIFLIVPEGIYLFFRNHFRIAQVAEIVLGVLTLILFAVVWIARI